MTREKFKRNLSQALNYKDESVSDETLEKFLDLNFDKDSSLADWEFEDFLDFASSVAGNYYSGRDPFWETVRELDLHYLGEEL